MKDAELAKELTEKHMNQSVATEYFNSKEAKEKVKFWYYYSNQLPILHMANNEYRVQHNITEHMIIMAEKDFEPDNALLRVALGVNIDLDLIVLNQLMFTFRR